MPQYKAQYLNAGVIITLMFPFCNFILRRPSPQILQKMICPLVLSLLFRQDDSKQ